VNAGFWEVKVLFERGRGSGIGGNPLIEGADF